MNNPGRTMVLDNEDMCIYVYEDMCIIVYVYIYVNIFVYVCVYMHDAHMYVHKESLVDHKNQCLT